jgi:hypothetical protein
MCQLATNTISDALHHNNCFNEIKKAHIAEGVELSMTTREQGEGKAVA